MSYIKMIFISLFLISLGISAEASWLSKAFKKKHHRETPYVTAENSRHRHAHRHESRRPNTHGHNYRHRDNRPNVVATRNHHSQGSRLHGHS